MIDDPETDAPELPPTPIVVSPSNKVALFLQVMRQLGLIATGSSALLSFIGTRDLAGFLLWLQGDGFAGALFAASALAIAATGWVKTIRDKRKLTVTAAAAPNKVAVVLPR